MSKVVALMSMSLDGYVADPSDGVDEVFDWYFSGDVEVPTPSPATDFKFRVSTPSADHLRSLMAEVGSMLTGRRTFERADGWGGQHPFDVPAFVVTHDVPQGWPRPGSTVEFVTDGIEAAVNTSESGCRSEVRGSARRRNDPAVPRRRAARRDPHRSGRRLARRRSAAVRPPREYAGRPRKSDGRRRCGRDSSALSRAQVVMDLRFTVRPVD